jgi:hypothetical protein
MSSDLNEITKQQSGLIHDVSGFVFRDLNKNDKLDIYEDSRQLLEARVEDLLSQMSLEEKAGMLFIDGAIVNGDGSIEEKPDVQGFVKNESLQPVADSKCTGDRALAQ